MSDRPDDAPPPSSARPLRGVLGRLLPLGAKESTRESVGDEAGCSAPSLSEDPRRPQSTGASQESAASRLRRVLPDIYFVNTPAARAERHIELLERLRSERPSSERPSSERPSSELGAHRASGSPVLDFHKLFDHPLTECTLCAYDEPSPGLLAKVCGTMAALNLSIHTAFIYTLRVADSGGGLALSAASEPGEGQAVALNTFLVSESYFGHDRALTHKTQKKLSAEVCRVLRGQARVPDLLARSRRAPERPDVHELLVENRPSEQHTRILLRAGDSFGVLYHATSAIAALNLSVIAAQVSTREAEADDLFFVTGAAGTRLPDADLPAIQSRLRALLQNEA